MGFDVPVWVRKKLVDRIVLSSFCTSTDFDMPIEIWRSLLGTDIPIYAGLELLCRSDLSDTHPYTNRKEIIFGYASSFYYRGFNGIYLFNTWKGRRKADSTPA